MKKLLLFCSFLFPLLCVGQDTTKPWTFWWVMGNALDSANVSQQLTEFKSSGLGGVHIIPIYGAKGYESRFLPFLSAQYLQLLSHTIHEAQRLGLGLDMTLGTGWPLGGKYVTSSFAAKKFQLQSDSVQVLPTRQMVKRASPGAEGLVLDHFDAASFQHYVTATPFDAVKDLPIRAFYNDSYEVYEANWTTDFWDKFQKMRGYDLRPYVSFLKKPTSNDTILRVKSDYRESLSDLLLEQFTQPFAQYATQRGRLSRNQAHGSPGHLIDLYAAVDIPETESFGTSRFAIPQVRIDPDYEEHRFGRPNVIGMKFASSAAHLAGRKLISAETCTWLGNHFKVALSQVKPQIDELFTAGINHVFYHGTAYSPAEAPYPGWLFYASTHFGQSSHLWPDMPDLNAYVARCQALLQNSKPNADVLLYFPIHDLWAVEGNVSASSYPLQTLDVHHTKNWLMASPFGQTAQKLSDEGYQSDYISDRFVQQLRVNTNGKLNSGTATYEVLVIPPTTRIPVATAQKLWALKQQGAKVFFLQNLPKQVGGLANFQKQESDLQKIMSNFIPQKDFNFGINPEPFGEKRLSFIRQKNEKGYLYFVSNLDSVFRQGNIVLAKPSKGVEIFDPLSQKRWQTESSSFVLRLLPGQSVFIQSFDEPYLSSFPTLKPEGKAENITLNTPWQITFENLKPLKTNKLAFWTVLGDSTHQTFSGLGVYRTTFDIPGSLLKKEDFWIDLGEVRETAEVWLNGQRIGKAWCVPYRLDLPKRLLKKTNTLEVRVRNLSANGMIKTDRERPNWKSFYDINIVDITYKPLDISHWKPEPSGLLGPVILGGR